MVVDYKKFVPNAPKLSDGLLFALEQIPLVTCIFLVSCYSLFFFHLGQQHNQA